MKNTPGKDIPIDIIKAEITHELFMIEFDLQAENMGFTLSQDDADTPDVA